PASAARARQLPRSDMAMRFTESAARGCAFAAVVAETAAACGDRAVGLAVDGRQTRTPRSGDARARRTRPAVGLVAERRRGGGCRGGCTGGAPLQHLGH